MLIELEKLLKLAEAPTPGSLEIFEPNCVSEPDSNVAFDDDHSLKLLSPDRVLFSLIDAAVNETPDVEPVS